MKSNDDHKNKNTKLKIDTYGQIREPKKGIYSGLDEKVESEFDRIPPCNNWQGPGSLHHSVTFGSHEYCTSNSSNPVLLDEYIAKNGFDVAYDDYKGVFFIKKSASHYVVYEGCLEVAGSGPHKNTIENLIRNFLSYERIPTWEKTQLK